jgi:hypothetical protein
MHVRRVCAGGVVAAIHAVSENSGHLDPFFLGQTDLEPSRNGPKLYLSTILARRR